jgi:hypothetical protein
VATYSGTVTSNQTVTVGSGGSKPNSNNSTPGAGSDGAVLVYYS